MDSTTSDRAESPPAVTSLLLPQQRQGVTRSGRRLKEIHALPRGERLPLSCGQQRLWFVHRLQGTSVEYNMPATWRLHGDVDLAAIDRAINAIVERHEPFRARFEEVDGEPLQVIQPSARVPVQLEDLTALEPSAQDEAVGTALQREWEEPFDLTRAPLLRVRLLKLRAREHVLILTCHHIASDGWSQSVLNRELGALYRAFVTGQPNPLPPLEVRYSDFVMWERERLGETRMQHGLEYWRQQLAGIPDQLRLAADRRRPDGGPIDAASHETVMAGSSLVALRQLARSCRATVYMTLLTALGVLLARHSGQDDIVIASPVANRSDRDLEALIGFFVNRLPMRIRVNPVARFHELLADVRQTAFDAYQHGEVPFERIVEVLAPQRLSTVTPLHQVTLGLLNTPGVLLDLPGIDVEVIRSNAVKGRADLELHASERDGAIHFSWVYNTSIFDRWRIERMARHFERLLDAAVDGSHQPVGRIDLLDSSERRLIDVWSHPRRPHAAGRSALDLFEDQVDRTPDAVVLVYEHDHVTYGGLRRRAHQVACHLRSIGIGAESRVALCVHRSLEMVVGLLGVLRAGGAYVPIDPELPSERQAFVLRDADASVLLTQRELAHRLPAHSRILCLDADWFAIERAETALPPTPTRPGSAAYVIYTSGTTGRPKGVVVEHRQLANYIHGAKEALGFEQCGRHALVQPLWVDSSVTLLYAALSRCGRLHLVPEAIAVDATALAAYCAAREIDYLKIAPSHLAALQDGAWTSILPARTLVLGGETSRREWIAALLTVTRCRVFNHYGPTETTVGVLVHEVLPSGDHVSPVPIGRPIANVRAYVVDEWLSPVPVGVQGELLIAGDAVARGYHGRPALTAVRFVADPWGPPGSRVYRTGDLARWRSDGEVEFLGRADDQVKIRGFRVELREIEETLRADPRVQDALAILQTHEPVPRLLAYVVPHAGAAADPPMPMIADQLGSALRQSLKRVLPDYMIPVAITVLPSWPRTPHGKVDRSALPPPSLTPNPVLAEEPRTPEEAQLCAVFAEVLGLPHVGVHQSFFALGGHSLLAMRLVSRVRSVLGIDVPLREIFAASSVGELSAVIVALRHLSGPAADPPAIADVDENYL